MANQLANIVMNPHDKPEPIIYPRCERLIEVPQLIIPGWGFTPRTRKDLADIIDWPLRKAVLAFYDRNIRTLDSSANMVDLEKSMHEIEINGVDRYVFIDVDYGTLTDRNLIIAEELVKNGLAVMHTKSDFEGHHRYDVVRIYMQVNGSTSFNDIVGFFLSIAERFDEERYARWLPRYTMAEVKRLLTSIPMSENEMDTDTKVRTLARDLLRYFFDGEYFYLSREHYLKYKGVV